MSRLSVAARGRNQHADSLRRGNLKKSTATKIKSNHKQPRGAPEKSPDAHQTFQSRVRASDIVIDFLRAVSVGFRAQVHGFIKYVIIIVTIHCVIAMQYSMFMKQFDVKDF